MTESTIETTIGLCIVDLTKWIMSKMGINHENAYRTLLTTQMYQVLKNSDSRLFLETNEFLRRLLEIELEYGEDAFYSYMEKF